MTPRRLSRPTAPARRPDGRAVCAPAPCAACALGRRPAARHRSRSPASRSDDRTRGASWAAGFPRIEPDAFSQRSFVVSAAGPRRSACVAGPAAWARRACAIAYGGTSRSSPSRRLPSLDAYVYRQDPRRRGARPATPDVRPERRGGIAPAAWTRHEVRDARRPSGSASAAGAAALWPACSTPRAVARIFGRRRRQRPRSIASCCSPTATGRAGRRASNRGADYDQVATRTGGRPSRRRPAAWTRQSVTDVRWDDERPRAARSRSADPGSRAGRRAPRPGC